MHHYCISRMQTIRRKTKEVLVGMVGVGGDNPIRVQSMTTTPTQDVQKTVHQAIALAECGCEIVRITAQNMAAAKALKDIRKEFTRSGFGHIPLVADIHFLPQVAMEAIEHVEKVRINPGNYVDKKKFAVLEYTNQQYQEEIDRIYEAFSPLVLRAKTLGKALRIGTNHGSLSDRIMNRYGDTPQGMVESAMEFIRIAQSHHFYNLVVSLKSSNPKTMIQAYRLAAQAMDKENMHYPFHLGVTEAGMGEDARIKSAVGIGSLLYDGIGDTIRVSFTEDPVYEIPFAKDLARRAESLWNNNKPEVIEESINFFDYHRRDTAIIHINDKHAIGSQHVPSVLIQLPHELNAISENLQSITAIQARFKDTPIEGLIIPIKQSEDIDHFKKLYSLLSPVIHYYVLGFSSIADYWMHLDTWAIPEATNIAIYFKDINDDDKLDFIINYCQKQQYLLVIDADYEAIIQQAKKIQLLLPNQLIFTLTHSVKNLHAIGQYRALASTLAAHNMSAPIWLRYQDSIACSQSILSYSSRMLEASVWSGSLLCDGIGDMISIESEPNTEKALTLAYNILQATRLRHSKTEFVACPSCGRTLFDLQSTTLKIKEATGHLKGVTIAVMGCIVNGPGEMADADFGYVGGAPGKINLYVGKQCVQYNIPESQAVESLVNLIKKHNKWTEA